VPKVFERGDGHAVVLFWERGEVLGESECVGDKASWRGSMVTGYGEWACLVDAEYCSGWEHFRDSMAADFQ
jgi:hypothetical protein